MPQINRASVPAFKEIELQVTSWCNRSCTFCAASRLELPKQLMSMETAERIAGQLADIGFEGTIGLHLMCEPLLHKRFEDIVALFRAAAPKAFIRIDTNGDPLKSMERLHACFEAGLNEVEINCYDSAEQFAQRNDGLRRLVQDHPGIWYWNASHTYPSTPRHTWRFIKMRAFWTGGFDLRNWAGLVPGAHDDELSFPLQLPCSRVTLRMHVNYLGQVILCNNDWTYAHVAADLNTQDILDAWAAPMLEEYRARLTQRDRSLSPCDRCDDGYPRSREPGCPPSDGLVKVRRAWILGRRHLQGFLAGRMKS
ncbi:MAG: radical SAM/SPASM domain-containing protein [Actinomycetota bacterium]